MSAVLADVTPGFRDAVHGAQQTYRVLLTAMSRPGLILQLPASTIEGLGPPASIGVGAAAALLALLDAETTATLAGSSDSASARAYLRFHTGVRVTTVIEEAAFAMARGHEVDVALWSRLGTGSDEAPQAGSTLILEVDRLGQDTAGRDARCLVLQGPGIATVARLAIAGPSHDFWDWRIDMQRRMPCGVDLMLVCGDRLAALPRSTRIVVSEGRS